MARPKFKKLKIFIAIDEDGNWVPSTTDNSAVEGLLMEEFATSQLSLVTVEARVPVPQVEKVLGRAVRKKNVKLKESR